MSSLNITPGGVCGIGFVSSGSSALSVVAHVINENGLFTASAAFSFFVLWCACFGVGFGGECFGYFCSVFYQAAAACWSWWQQEKWWP